MAETGSISIFIAFIISAYVLISSLIGAKTRRREFVRSAENGAFAICFLLTIACLSLVHGLLTRDFSLRYVAMNTSTDLSTIYTITALWAGQAGSLLLWSWILSVYMALAVLWGRRHDRKFMPYVLVVLAAVSCFFTYLIGFVESPFEKLSFVTN